MSWGWRGCLLFLLCQSWAPRWGEAEPAEPTTEKQLRRGDSLTALEIESILGQILREELQEAEPTGENPLIIPKPEEKTVNSTGTAGGAEDKDTDVAEKEEENVHEKVKEEEELQEQEKLKEEENAKEEKVQEEKEQEKENMETGLEKEENEDIFEDVSPTTVEGTSSAVEDNFSYIFSRLSAIESAIHRLNVQFYGMDVKMSQFSQSLVKLRSKLDDTQDTLTSVSEMNNRNQRHIGQIEGCLKGRRGSRRCYLLFRHFESYVTAQQLCHGRGGNLAMPIDQQEYGALAKYIYESLYPFNWPVWIGINDHRSEGMYLYENGHRVSFFNWYKDPYPMASAQRSVLAVLSHSPGPSSRHPQSPLPGGRDSSISLTLSSPARHPHSSRQGTGEPLSSRHYPLLWRLFTASLTQGERTASTQRERAASCTRGSPSTRASPGGASRFCTDLHNVHGDGRQPRQVGEGVSLTPITRPKPQRLLTSLAPSSSSLSGAPSTPNCSSR